MRYIVMKDTIPSSAEKATILFMVTVVMIHTSSISETEMIQFMRIAYNQVLTE